MTTGVELVKELISTISAMPDSPIKRVWYGDVDKITQSIEAAVELETKRTEYRTTARGVQRTYRVHIFVYYAFVRNPEYNREYCDTLAETIETVLDADPSLNGKVLSGLVTEVASGYSQKEGNIVRASRITYEATAVAYLPTS